VNSKSYVERRLVPPRGVGWTLAEYDVHLCGQLVFRLSGSDLKQLNENLLDPKPWPGCRLTAEEWRELRELQAAGKLVPDPADPEPWKQARVPGAR